MRLIVDAHQDLAWNMLTFGREYTRSALETRRLEAGSWAVEKNGDTLLGWPDYQQGSVALVFATLFASPARGQIGDWDAQAYKNVEEAYRTYKKQAELYHRLCDQHPDKFRLFGTRGEMEALLTQWQEPAPEAGRAVGLVPLMEGGDGIRNLDELGMWWELGVRMIGPAWKATRFCGGTNEPGPLTRDGFALLEAMQEIGFILDISHMDEPAALQALDRYEGVIIASHANPRAMLRGTESNRHLGDGVLGRLFERGGVTGIVPFNPFLKRGWSKNDRRSDVPLTVVANHIDYVCQLIGSAKHVGIGSDFDGGFGLQETPDSVDTIADLQKLAHILEMRGYNQEDVAAILGGNWLDILRKALPA